MPLIGMAMAPGPQGASYESVLGGGYRFFLEVEAFRIFWVVSAMRSPILVVEVGQTVVVTGRNDELRRELAVQNRRHPTHVLGFASNMHELMAVADLIITKPGGLTTSEALAMGKPLFILNPIPGQEAANSDFLLERGAATKVNRVEDLPFRIEQLLGSRKLAEMARAAKKLGRPQAAADICRAVLARVESK